MHPPTLALVVINCVMLGGAIVPNCDRSGLPLETACKLRPNYMIAKPMYEATAFIFGHTFKSNSVRSIDE